MSTYTANVRDIHHIAHVRHAHHYQTHYINLVKQSSRFIAVGLLNTAIDFAILNALIFAFGLESESGLLFVSFKSIAFLAAAINSFVLNKHWVFEDKKANRGKKLRSQIYRFASVSVTGLFINIVISYAAFSAGHRFVPDISSQLIANGSALVGVAAVLLSNFFGYKLLVFKK